ncbi:extracellular protein 6 [Aureobasidium pullulans]|nr:extracellular protein 6 [Aureobasidium pullulans]THW95181.1 extracellular protein 6 [Aureobasidium pullulans]
MKSVIIAAAATFGCAWASPIFARQTSSCTFSNTTTPPCGATSYIDYTVKSGDTLTTIAANPDLKSGVCDIAKVNCISNINLVIPGEVLKIPSFCTTPDNTSCQPIAAPATNNTCVKGVPAKYTVRSGDFLSKIAENFEITLAALEQANPQITNPDLIFPGQVINIPVCEGSSCIVAPYQIKQGDLYYDLAQTYHTTVGQIEAYNPNVDPLNITIGITIQLPQNCN